MRDFNQEDYLVGILHVPHMINDGEGNKISNAKYSKFSQEDKSLASCLLTSISSPISKELVGCMTAASIWSKLHQNFPSYSTTRIINLYDRMKVRKLFNQSMREYPIDIQLIIYDSLVGCGHPIEEM